VTLYTLLKGLFPLQDQLIDKVCADYGRHLAWQRVPEPRAHRVELSGNTPSEWILEITTWAVGVSPSTVKTHGRSPEAALLEVPKVLQELREAHRATYVSELAAVKARIAKEQEHVRAIEEALKNV